MQSVAHVHAATLVARPARAVARMRVVAAAFEPDFARTPRTSRRLEERAPLIEHLLVAPPAHLDGLPEPERDAARLLTLCSQRHALGVLRTLRPTDVFAEARLDHQPPPPVAETARLRETFADLRAEPLRPIQAERLMRYQLADIYAAVRGLPPRGTIGKRRAAACANLVMRELHPHLAPPLAADDHPPLTTLFDLPAEDGARRIEHFLGRKDTADARVAVISQYPYALAAHLNPHIRVRVHDCVAPFVDERRAAGLAAQRRYVLAAAAERKFGHRLQSRPLFPERPDGSS